MRTEQIQMNGITALASGMIGDAHQLVQQEIGLVKAEVRAEVTRLKAETRALAFGAALVCLGSVLVPFLLADLVLSVSDGTLPLWGAYTIVSVSLIAIGAIFYTTAKAKIMSLGADSEKQSKLIKKDFHATTRSFK